MPFNKETKSNQTNDHDPEFVSFVSIDSVKNDISDIRKPFIFLQPLSR